MKKKIIILFFAIMHLSSYVFANNIQSIKWATDSWDGFTNKDGTGLYHEIMNEMFKTIGIKVEVIYVPFARSLIMVKKQKADIAGGVGDAQDSVLITKLPIYESRLVAMFKKGTVGEWIGKENLLNKKVVAPPDYEDFIKVKLDIQKNRFSCISMLVNDRADFYVDHEPFIESFALTKKNLAKRKITFDRSKYETRLLNRSQLLMIFPNSARGKKIQEIYEKRTKELHNSGKLKPIYTKWKHSYPTFDF